MANFGEGIGDAIGGLFRCLGCSLAVVVVLAGTVVYLLATR